MVTQNRKTTAEIAELAKEVLKARSEKNHYDCPVCNGKLYISKNDERISCVENQCKGIYKEILKLAGQEYKSDWLPKEEWVKQQKEKELENPKQPQPIINGQGLKEWHYQEFKTSGIPKEVADLNFAGVSDDLTIADFLGWKWWQGGAGWVARTYDMTTGRPSNIGQFKPDKAFQLPEMLKPAKYLSQKIGYDALLHKVEGIDWQRVQEDLSIPIEITEGTKKALSGMIWTGRPFVAVQGVEMGFISSDGSVKKELVPNLKRFALPGRKFILSFDADWVEKKNVKGAIKKLGRYLTKLGCHVMIRIWHLVNGKGIDDLIVSNIEAGKEAMDDSMEINLDTFVERFEKQFKNTEPGKKQDKNGDTKESELARGFCDIHRTTLFWYPNTKQWFRYGNVTHGIWTIEADEFICQEIMKHLDTLDEAYSSNKISGVLKLIKSHLSVREINSVKGKIPFLNGVLNLSTNIFEPHCEGNRLTWCLPYEYNPVATCQPIQEWLRETVPDENQVQLLRAYLAAILKNRTDVQKFIEVLGPGGSGKSTFVRLAVSLVGQENNHATTLEKLEKSKFEPACLFNKRVVTISDSDSYGGSVAILKAIVGQDVIPYEVKGKQSSGGFIPQSFVIISANEPIRTTDGTSGLSRRKITIKFAKVVSEKTRRDLITLSSEGPTGEFAEYLPGLFNWVNDMTDEEIDYYLKQTESAVPSLYPIKQENLLATNPLAHWANEKLRLVPGNVLPIGLATRNKDSDDPRYYYEENEKAYASYKAFCEKAGRHPVEVQKFSHLLDDLLVNQLKLENVSVGRGRKGKFVGSYVEGVGLILDDQYRPDGWLIDTTPVAEQEPTPEITPEPEPIEIEQVEAVEANTPVTTQTTTEVVIPESEYLEVVVIPEDITLVVSYQPITNRPFWVNESSKVLYQGITYIYQETANGGDIFNFAYENNRIAIYPKQLSARRWTSLTYGY